MYISIHLAGPHLLILIGIYKVLNIVLTVVEGVPSGHIHSLCSDSHVRTSFFFWSLFFFMSNVISNNNKKSDEIKPGDFEMRQGVTV
jgi:hypothetical protein